MKLYLVRHAEAISAPTHPEHPLTENGILQAQALADRLRAKDCNIFQIFHSGILRAKQTAEYIANTLQISRIEILDHLKPNDSTDPIRREMFSWQNNTLIVSHQPYLDRLLSVITDPTEDIIFNNTTCVILEPAEEDWKVVEVLQPQQLT